MPMMQRFKSLYHEIDIMIMMNVTVTVSRVSGVQLEVKFNLKL
jgi:hypothetical protein